MSMQPLRPYQNECVDKVIAAFDGGLSRALYVLPTGTGKTRVFCELVSRLHEPGRPALVIAHREELLGQAWERIQQTNPDFLIGMERAGDTAPETADVVIASVQTIGRKDSTRLQWLADRGPSVIIVDEAHHAAADGYQRILQRFGTYDGRSRLAGCTATPKRMDKRALSGPHGATFEAEVYRYSIRAAIADGYLCPIRGYRVASDVDMSGVRTTAGDYNLTDLARVVDVEARTARALDHWQEVAGERRTIAFCVSVAHAEHVAAAWRERGVPAAHVHGGMDAGERRETLARHKRGELQVLTNCEVLTEGYDDPQVGCVVMLRPTKSWSLYVQMTGRGTRIAEGKPDVIVIDCVDNCDLHTLATVPAILDLPSGIDLQGRTLNEVADVVDKLGPAAGRLLSAETMARAGTLTFGDLLTKLKSVDLLSVAQTPEEIVKVSDCAWVRLPDGWLLECGGKRCLRVTEDALGWFHMRCTDRDIDLDHRVQRYADDFAEAISIADRMALELWPDSRFIINREARWRQKRPSEKQIALLRRFGLGDHEIASINAGEAGRIITAKFNSNKRPAMAGAGG